MISLRVRQDDRNPPEIRAGFSRVFDRPLAQSLLMLVMWQTPDLLIIAALTQSLKVPLPGEAVLGLALLSCVVSGAASVFLLQRNEPDIGQQGFKQGALLALTGAGLLTIGALLSGNFLIIILDAMAIIVILVLGGIGGLLAAALLRFTNPDHPNPDAKTKEA